MSDSEKENKEKVEEMREGEWGIVIEEKEGDNNTFDDNNSDGKDGRTATRISSSPSLYLFHFAIGSVLKGKEIKWTFPDVHLSHVAKK